MTVIETFEKETEYIIQNAFYAEESIQKLREWLSTNIPIMPVLCRNCECLEEDEDDDGIYKVCMRFDLTYISEKEIESGHGCTFGRRKEEAK